MKYLKNCYPFALLGLLALSGCGGGKEYEPDPATIPSIPPSDRGAGGEGGGPAGGKAGGKLAAPK